MSSNISDFHSRFYQSFTELYNLYDEVKKIVMLAEYENKQQKYLITSVNELRNSLDHIMRIVNDNSSLAKNFEKAKGHLYRAGYDAYEIIAMSKLNEIKEVKQQFSYDAIIEAYPDYHKRVIPSIKVATEKLSESRAHKQIDKELENPFEEKRHFEDFEMIVKELSEIVDDINRHIIGIKEAEDNIKFKKATVKPIYKTKEFWVGSVLIVFVLSILVAIVTLFTEYKFFVK